MPNQDIFFYIWTILALIFFAFIIFAPKKSSYFIPGRRRSKRAQAADDRRLRAFYAQEKSTIWSKRELTPYEILGVSPNASKREIEKAFKQRIKQYHPDKVIHLGQEFVTIAKERTIQITEAREAMFKKLNSSH